jgi:hypothetical protein
MYVNLFSDWLLKVFLKKKNSFIKIKVMFCIYIKGHSLNIQAKKILNHHEFYLLILILAKKYVLIKKIL